MSAQRVVLQRPTSTVSTVSGWRSARGDWFRRPRESRASATTAEYKDSRICENVIRGEVILVDVPSGDPVDIIASVAPNQQPKFAGRWFGNLDLSREPFQI